MIDLSYDYIVMLQNEVLRQFGVDNITPGLCKPLSTAILGRTTKIVSETTLKRFFGFAAAQHSFSRYTLNTLSHYCGYKDWDEFQSKNVAATIKTSIAPSPTIEGCTSKWMELKAKANAVSQYTIQTLKNRSGIPFNYTVVRQETIQHIERFLNSDYPATVFIAPPGWGKSISLVHAVEHCWFNQNAAHTEDICWFINAHAAGSLMMKGFSLANWLDNQLNLGPGENLREYFSNNPQARSGKLVLIIDGFDELNLGSDKTKMLYSKLEDFVYSNDEHPWVKVILSVRSSTWSELFQRSQHYANFRKFWFMGRKMDEETNINIPLLSKEEMKSVLNHYHFDAQKVEQLSDLFLQKLIHPYYLQLFCQLNEEHGDGFFDERLSLFEIASKFIQNRVFQSNKNTFKIAIIDKLLQLLDYGRNGLYADKALLLNKNTDLFPAYKELVTDNILVEENLSQEIMFNVKVRFTHNFMLEYFVAMHFYQNYGEHVREDMLNHILSYFPPSSFRISVLNWLVRCCINKQQYECIHAILKLPLTTNERSQILEYIVLHHNQEDRKPVALEEVFPIGFFKKHPISGFVNDDFVQYRKKKILDTFLGLAESTEDKLKIRSNLFVMALMQLDAESCEFELTNIRKLTADDEALTAMSIQPYEIFLFIYEYLKFGEVNEDIKEKIYDCKWLWLIGGQKIGVAEEIVCKAMCFAFLLMGDYQQLLNFTQRLFERYPQMLYSKGDVFRLTLLCWEAQAHLRVGNTKEGKRIHEHIDRVLKLNLADQFSTKHVQTLQKIIGAEICYQNGDYNRAIKLAESAMEMAQKLDFKLFALINYTILNKVYQDLNMEHQTELAMQQVALIQKNTTFKKAVSNFIYQ
ncbi:hypothetical protein COR50_03990 [Chitinophaga caeni]|uniref:NACHT domain-containing protein n=1 Tax=Chitinophaga caeni TaxID=2029983 RepID=A0A291QR58_9BACT|nr:hypothetical protein [Chitinophaga caeni]ATL46401.1 hypothetical protein COR50_03990 [Chitinophaga caeni]